MGDGRWEMGVKEICVLPKWKITGEFSNPD